MTEQRAKKILIFLIGVSTLVRAAVALLTELGNDEAYYWTYALFPSLSYFDHPPMVGFLIRLTTFNLMLNNELFVRLGSIILGSVNTYLIYLIGTKIKNPLTGLYSALLYTSSIYGFIITGIFILPDTPQVFFWLLSINFFLSSVTKSVSSETGKYLLAAGITAGLAMLSKYHSVFLWLGTMLYILLYNRVWLKSLHLYFAVIISGLIFTPVIIWNLQNDFISFTFQSGRVGLLSGKINPNTFFQEFFGQVFYNNPVNYVIIVLSLIALLKGKVNLGLGYKRFLVLTGLPVIIIFLFFSLTRSTFPHWSAPGYFSLILIASAYLADKKNPKTVPIPLRAALTLTFIIIFSGIIQLNTGFISIGNKNTSAENYGRNDVTLEMYGWKQIGAKFSEINERRVSQGLIGKDAPVIAHKWYDAAHIEYYAAYPLNKDVFAFSSITDIRNYNWLNRKRKQLTAGSDAYYITVSKDYKSPEKYAEFFTSIEGPDTIKVLRSESVAEYGFVYRLKGLKKVPAF